MPQPKPLKLPLGLTVTCLLVIALWGIYEAQPFLIPVSIAALLAFTMAPCVRALRRLHCPEWLSIALSAIILVLPFLSLIYLLVWQAQALFRDFPTIMKAVNQELSYLVSSSLGKRLHL